MTKTISTVGAMLCAVALLTTGCATTPGGGSSGLSDEEQIAQMFAAWKNAFELGDAEAFAALYSDSYTNNEGMDKEGIAQMITFLDDEGYLEYIEIGLDGIETLVTGDAALITGIAFESPEGSDDAGYELERQDDGAWIIVGDVD